MRESDSGQCAVFVDVDLNNRKEATLPLLALLHPFFDLPSHVVWKV